MRNVIKIIGCLCSLMFFAFILNCNVINSAQADVCFLPEGEGCDQVPYNEGCEGGNCAEPTPAPDPNEACNASSYCYATEEEAKNARGEIVKSGMDGKTTVLDSYSLNNGCYCLKKSCSLSAGSEAVINPETLYSDNPGGNWSCTQCNDSNSNLHGKYKCSCKIASRQGYYVDSGTCELKAETCAAQTSTMCEAQDVCHTCKGTGEYSGESECQRVVDVESSCPQGYSKTVPSSLCYDTVDMTCGNEGDKCYKTIDEPNCGANKRVSSADGVCSCTCATGYHSEGGECVKDECQSGMYDTEAVCCNEFCSTGDGGCVQDGNCWKRAKARISFSNPNSCDIALYLNSTRIETGSLYIEPGTYELWVATMGSATLGISGSVPSTTLTMSASGSAGNGTYGNYTFEAGKLYYLSTSNCSASTTTYTAKVVCERVADTYADCRLTQDTGNRIDHVYIEFTGTIYNDNPDEKWQNIYKNQTKRVYMNITGGKCHFGGPYSGQYGDIVSSSSAYCTLTYYPSTKFCSGLDCD